MKIKIKIVFSIMFLVVISLPFILSDKKGGSIAPEENRYLAEAPHLSLHKGFNREVENWINDNAGGRTLFRSIYNYTNINILKSKRDSQFYYANDWVYLINGTLQYLQNTDAMNREQIDDLRTKYQAIMNFTQEHDIDFCSVVFPHKVDVYPENINKDVKAVNPISQLEILYENFASDKTMSMSVAFDELIRAKNEGQLVYSKAYDASHWNNQGAFIGYKILMNQIRQKLPDIKVLEENDFDRSEIELIKIYNGRTYKEKDIEFKLKKDPHAQLDMSYFEKVGFLSKDIWNSYRYYKNDDTSLPKVIIVGDSYIWMFLLPNIAESFSELLFIHELDSDQLLEMADILHPNVIVFAGLSNTVVSAVEKVNAVIDNRKLVAELSNGSTAMIVLDDTPAKIKKGVEYKIKIKVKNNSSIAWNSADGIGLCIWRDGEDQGFRVPIEAGKSIKPGEEYTFILPLLEGLGSTSHTMNLEYQMVYENYCYFGEKTSRIVKIE